MRQSIEQHAQETGQLPLALTDLAEPNVVWMHEDDGPILDEWRNPVQYRRDENGFSLYSLGRDGKPGGAGLDCDIYSNERDRRRQRPTFVQFFFETDRTKRLLGASAYLGFMGALVCHYVTQKPPKNRAKMVAMTVAVIFVSGILIVVAVFFSILHVN